ncbi:MAG: hypothetical protein NT069_23460 [Planctomycetota bacterium]|nr:hypothetical protein [Planctomycetota bacterium]
MSSETTPDIDSHPLSPEEQQRNLLLFGGCVGMQYLAAPVLYVGATHAVLLKELKASNVYANSPESIFMACTVVPVIVAALFPGVRWLKPLMVLSYFFAAVGTGLVALSVGLNLPGRIVGLAVLLQSVMTGLTIPLAITLVWEAILAAIGSLGAQALLNGEILTWNLGTPLAFPGNYAVVFLAAVFPMLMASWLASRFVIPAAKDLELKRQFSLLAGARDFRSDRLLLRIAIVTVLLYAGNMIIGNLSNYTQDAMGRDPQTLVMYGGVLRYGTKACAGLMLGWLMTRGNPRAGLVATGLIFLLAPTYALFATGFAYLATFQIFGAGELVGVYAPNYLLAASRPRDLRRNMAYSNLLMAPAALMGLVFGKVADFVGQRSDQATGYRASFAVCAVVMAIGLALTLIWLPRSPVTLSDKVTPTA